MIWRGKWRKEVCSFLHSVLIVHPYALEVLCLKVRTSLQVLGFTCTIYYPSFKSKIQSLDPLGSKSRKTGWVVVSLQRFEHFDLIFVKARKIVAYLFLKITLNVLHNLFQPSFLNGHKQETSTYIINTLIVHLDQWAHQKLLSYGNYSLFKTTYETLKVSQ